MNTKEGVERTHERQAGEATTMRAAPGPATGVRPRQPSEVAKPELRDPPPSECKSCSVREQREGAESVHQRQGTEVFGHNEVILRRRALATNLCRQEGYNTKVENDPYKMQNPRTHVYGPVA